MQRWIYVLKIYARDSIVHYNECMRMHEFELMNSISQLQRLKLTSNGRIYERFRIIEFMKKTIKNCKLCAMQISTILWCCVTDVYLSLNKVFFYPSSWSRVCRIESHDIHIAVRVCGKKKVDSYSIDVIQRVRRVVSTGRQATISVNDYVMSRWNCLKRAS